MGYIEPAEYLLVASGYQEREAQPLLESKGSTASRAQPCRRYCVFVPLALLSVIRLP